MKIENLLRNKWQIIGAEKFCNDIWQPCNNYVDGMTWEFYPQFFDANKSIGYIVECTPNSLKSIKLTYVYDMLVKELTIDLTSGEESIKEAMLGEKNMDIISYLTTTNKKDSLSGKEKLRERRKSKLCIADGCATEDCALNVEISKNNIRKTATDNETEKDSNNISEHEIDVYKVEFLDGSVGNKEKRIMLSILTEASYPPPHFRYILRKIDYGSTISW